VSESDQYYSGEEKESMIEGSLLLQVLTTQEGENMMWVDQVAMTSTDILLPVQQKFGEGAYRQLLGGIIIQTKYWEVFSESTPDVFRYVLPTSLLAAGYENDRTKLQLFFHDDLIKSFGSRGLLPEHYQHSTYDKLFYAWSSGIFETGSSYKQAVMQTEITPAAIPENIPPTDAELTIFRDFVNGLNPDPDI